MLNKDEADRLSNAHKVITEDIHWRRASSSSLRLRARVLAPAMNEVLELRGTVGKTNFSFTLLFQKLPIRRYENRGRHTDPDGNRVDGPHKHTWDEVYGDGFTYVPDDIDPSADLNEQFLAFLVEQNIHMTNGYQHQMFEIE